MPDAVPDSAVTTDVILSVEDITVDYGTSGKPARAVDQVSFQLARGEFLGIVGESGCGKSTLLFAIAQLLSPPAQLVSGTVTFKGRDMVGLTGEALRTLRWRDYSVVMQSAMNALNPVRTIAAQYEDAMRAHGVGQAAQIRARGREVLALVGIDAVHLKSIVEIGPTRPLFAHPQHPYTRGLLDSFPSVYGPKVHLKGIPGAPPDLADLPSGCRFRPRCPDVMPRCAEVEPALYPAAEARVRCLLYGSPNA